MNLAGLQPDTAGVGDGDAVDGEIVEQVATHALDIDPSIAAQLLAGDETGHQLAA